MKLRAKRMTAQQAVGLWEQFYELVGAERMEHAYAWSSPQKHVRPGERVWAFGDVVNLTAEEISERISVPGGIAPVVERQIVGWGSLVMNLNDPDAIEVELVCGVFPSYQRRGYRVAIREWMCDWARDHGAVYAKVTVFKENKEHYDRCMKEAKNKATPWVYAGDEWYPAPGIGIFRRDLTEEEEAKSAEAEVPRSAVRAA